jgi:hypothetical protein
VWRAGWFERETRWQEKRRRCTFWEVRKVPSFAGPALRKIVTVWQ